MKNEEAQQVKGEGELVQRRRPTTRSTAATTAPDRTSTSTSRPPLPLPRSTSTTSTSRHDPNAPVVNAQEEERPGIGAGAGAGAGDDEGGGRGRGRGCAGGPEEVLLRRGRGSARSRSKSSTSASTSASSSSGGGGTSGGSIVIVGGNGPATSALTDTSESSSAKTTSDTNTTTADGGYDRINAKFRSVLSNPVALLVLAALHDDDDDDNTTRTVKAEDNDKDMDSNDTDSNDRREAAGQTDGMNDTNQQDTGGDGVMDDDEDGRNKDAVAAAAGDHDHDAVVAHQKRKWNDATPVGLRQYLQQCVSGVVRKKKGDNNNNNDNKNTGEGFNKDGSPKSDDDDREGDAARKIGFEDKCDVESDGVGTSDVSADASNVGAGSSHGDGISPKDDRAAALSRFFKSCDARTCDDILQKSYEAYQKAVTGNNGETSEHYYLTDQIYKRTQRQLKKEPIEVCHQLPVPCDRKHPSTTDIVIHRRDDKDESAMLLLLEVGLCDEDQSNWDEKDDDFRWWKKVDQNMQYLEHVMNTNRDCKVKFTGPMIFAVLTFAKAKKSPTTAAAFMSARLGVFLCAPRTHQTFRVSLLRRDLFSSLRDASRGFGKTLRAASALAGLLHDIDGGCVFDRYQFLGPNCCRIGNKVLRAYDTRFRPTHRRPDLYGDATIAPGARVVCRVVDPKANRGPAPPPHGFRLRDSRAPVTTVPDKRVWCWQFRGELLVIETDYIHGRHFAKTPDDFTRVVEHLKKIHDAGYVHGDIRCANIVFPTCLIDFDMGGRLADDKPTYPPGYVQALVDGDRRGESGKEITKADDWSALLKVIFGIHGLLPPNHLFPRFAEFARMPLDGESILTLPRDLNTFLEDVKGDGANQWHFAYRDSFKTAFVSNWSEDELLRNDPRDTSDPATGSPQK